MKEKRLSEQKGKQTKIQGVNYNQNHFKPMTNIFKDLNSRRDQHSLTLD